MTIVNWIISRLREPSTWAALAASGVLSFVSLDPASDMWRAVVTAGTAIAGLLAVVLKEKGAA